MKKKIALIITAAVAVLAIVATIVVVAFLNTPATKKRVVRKKVVVVNDSVENGDNSQNDDFQYDTSFDNFDSNLSFDNELSDGLFYVLKKIIGTNIGKNYYVVSLKDDHPGVVGYDADYEVLVYNKMGHLISNDELNITVNNTKVKNNNGKLTIPYSVRTGSSKLIVTVENKLAKNLTGEYTFDFKKFTDKATYNEDFNSLDTDKWIYTKTNGVKSDEAYTKDGSLVLKSESVNGVTNLTSAFKQSYGCFSAKIKMHEKGLANFTFSLRTEQRYVKNEDMIIESGGEITAVEYFPYWNEKWSSCVRWFGWNTYSKKSRNEDLVCKNISEAFHTYSVVWTADNIFWYLDGKLVNTYTGEGVAKGSNAMNITLKLVSYDKDNYRGGPLEPNAFPFAVEIDNLEVYGLIEK